jgi:hypothetical protein
MERRLWGVTNLGPSEMIVVRVLLRVVDNPREFIWEDWFDQSRRAEENVLAALGSDPGPVGLLLPVPLLLACVDSSEPQKCAFGDLQDGTGEQVLSRS